MKVPIPLQAVSSRQAYSENLTISNTDKETVSWLCIVCAAPLAVAGFFKYNGMNFEQFVTAFIYSELLCSGVRTYQSENYLYDAYKEVIADASNQKEPAKKGKKGYSQVGAAVDSD